MSGPRLVRPDGIASLEANNVLTEIEDNSFAAKVERTEIKAGAELLGVPLEEHVKFVIEALRSHVGELGLTGR